MIVRAWNPEQEQYQNIDHKTSLAFHSTSSTDAIITSVTAYRIWGFSQQLLCRVLYLLGHTAMYWKQPKSWRNFFHLQREAQPKQHTSIKQSTQPSGATGDSCWFLFGLFFILKMEPTSSSETLADFRQTARNYIWEGRTQWHTVILQGSTDGTTYSGLPKDSSDC